MKIVRTGLLVGIMLAELAVSGIAWAQSTSGAVRGIDIIVRKKPGHANMACMVKGSPCNREQVQLVSAEASKRGVMVALAGSDGSLKCSTRDGKGCTEESVVVVQVAGKAVATKGISGNRSEPAALGPASAGSSAPQFPAPPK